MRVFAAIVALCAAVLLFIDWRHSTAGDPRRLSRRAARITFIVAVLSVWAAAAHARPSPYPPVTPFIGDRYSAHAQADKARYLYPTRKRPPVSRQKWRAGPTPAGRPVTSNAYRVDVPISLGEGLRRGVGRPAAWCGWWLGHHLGMPLRKLWLARNWASVGSSVGGPRVGAIVVWAHHVGIITGRRGNQWVVKSGNDGRRVRERPRSVAGAIAFRRV